jgi:hypothetical protein
VQDITAHPVTDKWTRGAFKALIVLYVAAFWGEACWAYFSHRIWLTTGLLIGLIYPLVAFYYFYSGYFVPYHQEKRRVNVEGGGLAMLLFQWMLPIFIIQVFICLAFWLTINRVPTVKTLYTNPYQYGLLYKQLNALDMEKTKPGNADAVKIFLADSAAYFKPQAPPAVKDAAETPRQGEKEASKEPQAPDPKVTQLVIFTIPFYIAVTFGFLGSLIYTLRDIGYRFYTEDLQPRTFVNYIIRFLFAVVICIVIAYFLMNDWWVNAAPLLFFFIGYFPDRGMQYIEETAMKVINFKKDTRLDLPLGLIQGTNDYLIYRFKEIGIHDIQNLAYVDLNDLRANMGYGTGLLCDFVAQALLLVHLKDHFATLQAFGIRNIVYFRRIVKRDNYQNLAKAMGIPEEKLLNTLEVISTEPMRKRLDDLETCRMEKSRDEDAEPTVEPAAAGCFS